MLTVTFGFTGGPTQTIAFASTASATVQTAAIQQALDSVAGHPGAVVTLSAGTFTLANSGSGADGCLRVGSDTTLAGAGMGLTVLQLAAGSGTTTGIVRTDSGQTLADGSIKTTERVLVRNLTIDGNKTATTGAVDGFYCGPKPDSAAADRDIGLDHVEIRNVSRYGFDPHEQTIGLTITDSIAHHNGLDGFTIDFCSDVTLSGNLAYGNGRHGFNIVTGSRDVALIGNEAYGNAGSGLSIQTGDNEARSFTGDVSVIGGSFHDNGRLGIEVKQADGIVVSGVHITGNGMGGILLRGVDGADLAGNLVAGNDGQALRVEGYLQDFGDTDPLNDRYVPTRNIVIDGERQVDPEMPAGATLWGWVITAGADRIAGSAGADRFSSGAGDDTVTGEGGNDLIYGGDGRDRLDGGAGNDTLNGGGDADSLVWSAGFDNFEGGGGLDTADFSRSSGAIYANLGAGGVNVLTSGASPATVTSATTGLATVTGVESLIGTNLRDTLIGSNAANALSSGSGNDTLSGGSGNDTLTGGTGSDQLTGGSGSDLIVLGTRWGTDTLLDWQDGRDKIDMTTVAGLTGFGQLSVAAISGGVAVSFGDDTVKLMGASLGQITAADFLLVS